MEKKEDNSVNTEPTSFKEKQRVNIFDVPGFGDTGGTQTEVKMP